jgi:hypothetical protein
MKNLLLIILSSVYLLFNTGCKRTCQNYSEKHLKWIPYENVQEIRFTNNQDTITFFIEGFSKTSEYEVSKRNDVSCEATASFFSEINNKLNIYIQGISTIIENSNQVHYNYEFIEPRIIGDEFMFSIENDVINGYDNFHEYHFFDKILLNDREYRNVIHLKKQTSATEQNIIELYIAENIGIVKFTENNGTEWFLINE